MTDSNHSHIIIVVTVGVIVVSVHSPASVALNQLRQMSRLARFHDERMFQQLLRCRTLDNTKSFTDQQKCSLYYLRQ